MESYVPPRASTPRKKAKKHSKCSVCGNIFNRHLRKRVIKNHLPWYMNPVTAFSDCLKSKGDGDDLQRFHRRYGHGVIGGESLLQALFLLMNGVFLFIMPEVGLGSLADLLAYAQTLELSPHSIRFSGEECNFLREFDRRAGLEPLADEGYMVFPPVRCQIT